MVDSKCTYIYCSQEIPCQSFGHFPQSMLCLMKWVVICSTVIMVSRHRSRSACKSKWNSQLNLRYELCQSWRHHVDMEYQVNCIISISYNTYNWIVTNRHCASYVICVIFAYACHQQTQRRRWNNYIVIVCSTDVTYFLDLTSRRQHPQWLLNSQVDHQK